MKLTKEQVMVAKGMSERTPVRQLAKQFGVRESTLRYRFKRVEEERLDGRTNQVTALDGYEDAVVAIQTRLGDGRLTGEGRPVQARVIYEALARDHGYAGSYQAVVRHLRRRYGRPKVRALRRVETPPGVQAQHDWFEIRVPIGGRKERLGALVGTLSHSRARFCWVSTDQGQLAWHTGHLALFESYGGVPLWVRIDNLKTGVARGAGPRAVLNRSYEVFARTCGFEIDPCRPGKGSDKGKAERSVRTFRDAFGGLLERGAGCLVELQALVDERARMLLERLTCPVTGTTVREAWEAERAVLQPLPTMSELFDVVVTRKVTCDCLISFEGRRYSVPFAWVGRHVDVWGTQSSVVIRAEGSEVARHARGTPQRLLIEPGHYEGPSTERVERPTPLGRRARLQVAGLSSSSPGVLRAGPLPEQVARPLDAYVRLVEAQR
ncbi:MAG: IS21 family transposase [Gemmatimonadota bacterium]